MTIKYISAIEHQGIEKGREEERCVIVDRLLSQQFDVETIAEMLGLDIAEVPQIQAEQQSK